MNHNRNPIALRLDSEVGKVEKSRGKKVWVGDREKEEE